MRAWLLLTALALGACAGGGSGSYDLGPGVANYDALKAATDKCHAEGGRLEIKSGYDQHELSSYVCRVGGH